MTDDGQGRGDSADEELGIKPKRIVTHPEFALQRGIMRFCKRAIACEFEFASHDRGRARSQTEHIYEAARGIRRSWPDVEVALAGGRTFRCELKALGAGIDVRGDQFRMIHRLRALGHPTWWANSVDMFASLASSLRMPLKANWRVVAAHEDQLVAADIRGQEVKAAAKRSGTHTPSKSRPRSRMTARDRKAAGIYARNLP